MFNGNISAMQWRVNMGLGDTTMRGYNFSYDPMNRLTQANHKTYNASTWHNAPTFMEGNLSYDLNGNITALKRSGATGSTMDDLQYKYGDSNQLASNRLLKVIDNSQVDDGFKDDVSGNAVNDYRSEERRVGKECRS